MNRIFFRGFSLVELVIVILLLALIGTVAIPAFGALIERSRATATADQLQAHLLFARTWGVSQRIDVEVCGSSNGVDCDHVWERGWIVRLPSSGELLRQHLLAPQEYLAGSRRQPVRYRSNGTSPLSNLRFYLCDRNASVVWQLVINNQGRVRRVAGLDPEQKNDEGLCPPV